MKNMIILSLLFSVNLAQAQVAEEASLLAKAIGNES